MYESVTFPEEEGDIGRAVQSAFAPVVEKGDAVDATEKKKKKGVDIVGLSVSMAVTVVCFAGIILFATSRQEKTEAQRPVCAKKSRCREKRASCCATSSPNSIVSKHYLSIENQRRWWWRRRRSKKICRLTNHNKWYIRDSL